MSSTSKDRKKRITFKLAEVVTSANALLTPVTEIMNSISFRKLSKGGQNCSVAKWGLSYLGLIFFFFFFFLSQGSKDSRPLSLQMVVLHKKVTQSRLIFATVTGSLAV